MTDPADFTRTVRAMVAENDRAPWFAALCRRLVRGWAP